MSNVQLKNYDKNTGAEIGDIFPITKAENITFSNDENLQDMIDEGKLIVGGPLFRYVPEGIADDSVIIVATTDKITATRTETTITLTIPENTLLNSVQFKLNGEAMTPGVKVVLSLHEGKEYSLNSYSIPVTSVFIENDGERAQRQGIACNCNLGSGKFEFTGWPPSQSMMVKCLF